jgi:D-aspartate ligase
MIQSVRQSPIPVVVVDSTLNALGVVRSLARGKMPIFMVTKSRLCPGAWSRYCRVLRFRRLGGREFIDELKVLGSRLGGRPVLLLTRDVEVEAVSLYREELQSFFRISLPSQQMVSMLADKSEFQTWAEREQFPVPRAVVLTGKSDLAPLAKLDLPVVIKPAGKGLANSGEVERAVRAETLDQARDAAGVMLVRARRVIVQEWIDGDDTDIYFVLFTCDSAGAVVCMFSGRKLVSYPPQVGGTAICISAEEVAAELEILTRDFIQRTDYKGVGGLEFKRDRRSGEFIIVEPTVGRTDWQEEIATLCGVNIPLATYWAEIGAATQATPGKPRPLVWRSSLAHRLPRELAPARTRIWDGYFRLADPVPGIYYYGIEVCCRKLAKLLLPANAIAYVRRAKMARTWHH